MVLCIHEFLRLAHMIFDDLYTLENLHPTSYVGKGVVTNHKLFPKPLRLQTSEVWSA